MPNYDYTCLKCHKSFELFQSMKDEPLTTCPESACQQKKWGKGKVKREIGTGAGLIFKGSGFYITDYRSENYKSGVKADSAPAASSTDSASSSTNSPKADAPSATPKAEPAAKAPSSKKTASKSKSAD
jgi:putative FmdB family regulatory protein